MLITNSGRALVVSVITISSLGLIGGCSSSRTGSPSPVEVSTSSASATANSGTTQSAQDNPLSSVNACDLLTDRDTGPFKTQGQGHEDTSGSSGAASDCQWVGRSANDSSTAFGVLVRPTQGIDDINTSGGKLTRGDVNSRPAAQFASNIGAKCLIALAVTPTSRVDISYVIGAGTDSVEACQTADQIAGIVEPRLPKYQG